MPEDCLLRTLAPLKESSRLAIADAVSESFTNEKKYLHIERLVELELERIIKNTSSTSQATLVLVCGNVGDGKSHLISALKQKNPQDFEPFLNNIYNDATESSSPTRNNIDELRDILAPFSDIRLAESKQKAILAINLGTLSNFIVADDKNEFSKLAFFVKKNQILEIGSVSEGSVVNPESNFQYVSLCDHNLFYLTDEGPTSNIIEEAFNKIVINSSYENVFRETYRKSCLKCSENCPIKLNYELFSLQEVRTRISSLLIQSIIKHHHIVSIRSLYSFIYDLIVPVSLDGMGRDSIKKWISDNPISSEKYIGALIPNYIFEHPEVSRIFEHLHYLDPSLKRNSELDGRIIRLVTSNDPSRIVGKCDVPQSLKSVLIKKANSSMNKDNDSLVKTYIRLTSLIEEQSKIISFEDKCYSDYVRFLYGWFQGNKNSIKQLYKQVLRAAMLWNGETFNSEMLIDTGNQQLKYRISENVNLVPGEMPTFSVVDGRVEKFSNIIPLSFITGKFNKKIVLNLDCRMFEMLSRIVTGYRINQIDKRNFIGFSSFVTDIMNSGELAKRIRISESETRKQYILEKDEFGDFVFNSCEGVV